MNSNLEHAEADWPPAVVCGAYFTGLLLMKYLVRRKVKTCLIDWRTREPGFRTVYGPGYECPNPDVDSEAWLKFVIGIAKKMGGRPVLIPTTDQFVSTMAVHADELAKHFTFCNSAIKLQALLSTKEEQYALAAKHGMPIPRTQYASHVDDVEDFATTAKFPCLLKPLQCREWEFLPPGHPMRAKKLVIADNWAHLIKLYGIAAAINPQVVLQEIIEGPDTAKLIYFSCYDQRGTRIASCMARELRTMPLGYGPATIVEPVDDPETDAFCDKFLRDIGYVGLCEIELKRDNRTGKVLMIEANPRYSGSADFAPYAGVDLAWLHYLDLVGKKVVPVRAHHRPFKHIVLQRDVMTIPHYLRTGRETWSSILRSYRPPLRFFDVDWRDWRVTAGTFHVVARYVAGRAVRKIAPRWRAAN